MINRVCAYIHNWFTRDKQGNPYTRWTDDFTIADGALELPLLDGQYYLITGSKLNDGIHKYPSDDLTDETFSGTVYECIIPREVIEIADEISEWQEANKTTLLSPFQSESFGGYSYQKGGASAPTNALGNGSNWETVYGYRLNPWRKLSDARK